MKQIILFLLVLVLSFNMMGQLQIVNSANPQDLVQNTLIGQGVQVSNVQFTGNINAIGTFDSQNSNVGIPNGLIMSTGHVNNAIGPNNDPGGQNGESWNEDGDPDLDLLVPGLSTYDAAILEFDFVPLDDTIEFNYVFASDEYLEFVNAGVNDVFGFFLSGPGINGPFSNNARNIALIPNTTTAVSIDNVNNVANSQYYVDNGDGQSPPQLFDMTVVQFDGLTVSLTARVVVQTCETYHIKLAIADVGDGIFDSAVFLEEGSFTLSTPIANAGPDRDICSGEATTIGFFPIMGQTYDWSPSDGLSSTTSANPSVTWENTTDEVQEYVYYLTVDAIVCDNSNAFTDSTVVRVHPLPELDLGTDVEMCSNDTVQIGVSALVDHYYEWSPTDGVQNENASTTDVVLENIGLPADDYSYVLTVWDTIAGCSTTDTIDIRVNPFPEPAAGDDQSFCTGLTTQIGGGDNIEYIYSWSPSQYLDQDDISNPTVTYDNVSLSNDTLVYYEQIEYQSCTTYDTVQLIIHPNPIIEAGNDVEICLNDSIQLMSTGGESYIWSPNTDIINGNTAMPTVFPELTSYYYVQGTDSNSCSATDSVQVEVHDLPLVTNIGEVGFCSDDTVNIGGVPENDVVYAWWDNVGLNDSTLSDPELTLGNITAQNDTSFYYVQGVDTVTGCVNIDTVQAVVFPYPVSSTGGDYTMCSEDTITMGVDSITDYTYLWSPVDSLSDTTSSYTDFTWINSDEIHDTLYYSVATTFQGCTSYDTAEVIVYGVPLIDAGSDVQICIGDSVQLNATGGVSYAWSPNIYISDTTLADPFVAPIDTMYYYLDGVDAFACPNNDSVQVIVNPLPTIDNGGDQYLCPGASIQLEVSGGDQYAWTPNFAIDDTSIFNPTVDPLATMTYYFIVTDSNGCVNNDSVLIEVLPTVPTEAGDSLEICYGDSTMIGGDPTGPAGTIYEWYASMNLTDTTLANPIAFPLVSEWFYVITSNDTCSGFDSTYVTVHNLPPAYAGEDEAICFGTSIELAASGGESYVWEPNTGLSNDSIFNPIASPDSTMDYIVWVTDSNSCVQTDTMNLEIYELPPAYAGEDTVLCIGDTIQLAASGGIGYHWSPNESMTNDTINDPLVSPENTLTYTVVVTDINGCEESDEVEITVYPLPVITTNQDSLICKGGTATLWATGGESYSWTPSDYLNQIEGDTVLSTPESNITYTVLVTDSNTCWSTAEVPVEVNAEPTAGMDFTMTPSCDGIFVEFENTSIETESFIWNFGDGEGSTESNPEHTFSYDGNYEVILTATNNICNDSISMIVNPGAISENIAIEYTEILTFNGDGMNDEFEVTIEGLFDECIEIEIYDRWGTKLYNSSEHNWNWYGLNEYNAQEVSEGTYYFIILVNGQVSYKSFLTLVK